MFFGTEQELSFLECNKNDPFWNETKTNLFGMKQERTFLEMGSSKCI